MKQNKRDVGWMCHLVPLRKNQSPAYAPPISNIPCIGLSDDPNCDNPAPLSHFRPTDTPFVRLSRLGGRKDLLCFKENAPNRGYVEGPPRCDWFYLEDNALNDLSKETKQEKYEFKVPSYMSYNACHRQKIAVPIPQSSPPPLPKRWKVKRGKLPDDRPGYREYNAPLNKVGIAKLEYDYTDSVRFPKALLDEQPENMASLIGHKYMADYSTYRKQWREVDNLRKSHKYTCAPVPPKTFNDNIPKKKK